MTTDNDIIKSLRNTAAFLESDGQYARANYVRLAAERIESISCSDDKYDAGNSELMRSTTAFDDQFILEK